MRKYLSIVILLALLLLPSCRMRPIDAPETTEVAPADTRTQDEILAALFAETDGPVVVQLIGRSPYLFQEDLAPIWSAPHVINVLGTSYVHWLDDSEENSRTMIGQYAVDLDPADVIEGRWYETDSECCVNRAEYDRLLADPTSGFAGIGDTVTYTEPKKTVSGVSYVKQKSPVSKEFKIVGLVKDSDPYDSTAAYAIHHIYTTVDGVTAMMENYNSSYTNAFSDVDKRAYWNARIEQTHTSAVVYKEDPDRTGKVLFRGAEDRIYTEDEWMAQYRDTVCNAGYTVEITLDSGKNYADFAEYLRLTQFTEEPASERLNTLEKMNENAYEQYEKLLEPSVSPTTGELIEKSEEQKQKAAAWLEQTLAKNAPDATTARLQEIGELDEWFRCKSNVPYVIHPLRVEE